MTDFSRDLLGLTLTLMLVLSAWFFLYIHPREVFLHQVMSCMVKTDPNGDHPETSYRKCKDS